MHLHYILIVLNNIFTDMYIFKQIKLRFIQKNIYN